MSVPLHCTLETCPLKWGYLHYRPSVPGNAFMLAAFAVLIPPAIVLGVRKHKAYLFTTVFTLGLLSEVIGYAGRILLNKNPFLKDYFLTYLICLTLGPTFLSAAIYLTLARIVVVYGEHLSRIKPRSYTLIFLVFDIAALAVQGGGGGMAAVGWTKAQINKGTHILIAGLALQVFSLVMFMTLCLEFAWRVRNREGGLNPKYAPLQNSRHFKIFLGGIALAILCLFIRSLFRVAELSNGFGGKLAQNQVSFMVLDGVMVLTACITLTVLHPCTGFGEAWGEASFRWRTKNKESPSEREPSLEVETNEINTTELKH